MVGPTRDPRKPRLEQPKLGIAELVHQLLQQEDCEYFFFQNATPKELVRDFDKKFDAALLDDCASKSHGDFP